MSDKVYEIDEQGRYTYFNTPTQIKYFDVVPYGNMTEVTRRGAIAYHDKIICGCCGGIIDLKEYYEGLLEWIKPEEAIKPYNEWVDISEGIVGE